MGTYALSAGYYDAYYKRAQQVPLPPLQREEDRAQMTWFRTYVVNCLL